MATTTIIMTPRERFGITRQSYESLRQHTSGDYDLVIVDGGSPPATMT